MYTKEEIEFWFTRLAGENPTKAARFKALHDTMRTAALQIREILPEDRHESVVALDHLQAVVHWGNDAIAREGSASGVAGSLTEEEIKIPEQQPDLVRL